MRRIIKIFTLVFCIVLLLGNSVNAEDTVAPAKEPESKKRLLTVPYPFFNDTIGSGLGVAVIAEGYIQPQVLTVGSGLVSTEGTYLMFLMMRNYQSPWMKRVFLEPATSYSDAKEIKFYGGSNPSFPGQRPGANDSDEDNFSEADGTDGWFDFSIKYLLPIGHGRDHILPQRQLDNGLLVSGQTGGEHWNPLKSGRTYFELKPFFRDQELKDAANTSQKTAGIEVALTYDNTDFPSNPAKGNYLRVFFDRDWGGMDSSAPWSVWGGEFSQYFDLGSAEHARQRVVAFNFWTVHSPTWDSSHTENGQNGVSQAPNIQGSEPGRALED